MGTVEKETQNLTELKKRDEHVVDPIEYYQIGDQELHTTPYLYQARCIAGYGGYWGMYIFQNQCINLNVSKMELMI